MPQFVPVILDRQPLVQIGSTDAASLRAHGHDGSEALAREKVATGAGKYNSDRDDPCECCGDFFEHLLLLVKRLQDDEGICLSQ